MAVRKSTMVGQVAESISAMAPDDRQIATFHCVSGPSPYVSGLFGMVGQAFIKYYFVTLTEQAVLFHRAGKASNRPKDLIVAIPRAEAAGLIGEAKIKATWSSVVFQLPGKSKPTRLNVGRNFRSELEQFVQALTGAPVSS
jgi:hypothetical protein